MDWVVLIHLVINILFWWHHSQMIILTDHKYIPYFPPQSKNSIYLPLPQISLSPSLQSYSVQVPDHRAKPWASAHDWYIINTSGRFSFQAKWTSRCSCLQSCPLGDFFLPCSSESSQIWPSRRELGTSRWYLPAIESCIHRPGLGLHFLC